MSGLDHNCFKKKKIIKQYQHFGIIMIFVKHNYNPVNKASEIIN